MPGLNRFLGFYLLIGLLQGIVFYYADRLFTSSQVLLTGALAVALVGGTLLQLLGGKSPAMARFAAYVGVHFAGERHDDVGLLQSRALAD